MIINPIELIENGDKVIIQSLIEFSGQKKLLWYSVDREYGRYLTTEKHDGFLVGLLVLAMEYGDDVHVKGAVSERLFYNISNYLIPIVRLIIPSLKQVRIIPDTLDNGKNYDCDGGVVTGFSAGVDSFCTVLDHLNDDVPPSYRLTHLVFNNVGSHGLRDDAEEARQLFHSRYDLISDFPIERGIPFFKIDSNLNEFLTRSFITIHTLCNISAIMMLQKLFSKYLYSSAAPYQNTYVGGSEVIDDANSMIVPLLSTESLESVDVGAQYTRVEKTRRLTLFDGPEQWLNVCVGSKDGKNCSRCKKCGRTLFTLELLGSQNKFSKVFDLDAWEKVRESFIINTVLSKEYDNDPLVIDIREFARSTGFTFTTKQRFSALINNNIPLSVRQLPEKFIDNVVPWRIRKIFIKKAG